MQNVTLSPEIITTYEAVLTAKLRGQTVPEPRYGFEINDKIYRYALINGQRPHTIINVEPNVKLGSDYDLIKITAADGQSFSIRRKWLVIQ